MDLINVEKVMELMRKHGMSEVTIEDKEAKIKVSCQAAMAPHMNAPMLATHAPMMAAAPIPTPAVPQPSVPAAASGKGEGVAPARRGKTIKSPFVGTYYEASSPGSEPFVRVGQKVSKGDVLCIVEAMKLMNEIEAEQSGTITEILVNNGEPVQFDQDLFVIE